MIVNRKWAMPNKHTFDIKPIKELIGRYAIGVGADPFARDSKIAQLTNDLDPSTSAKFHMDALEFLQKEVEDDSLDFFLFDPPYSPRQVSEVYKKLDMTVNMQTTQSSFWSRIKNEACKKVKIGGHSLTFGWCSNGIGAKNGFEIVEIR